MSETSGSFTVEDGWACWTWDVPDGFKRCSRIYRNPTGGSRETHNEYIAVGTGCGVESADYLCPFSIED